MNKPFSWKNLLIISVICFVLRFIIVGDFIDSALGAVGLISLVSGSAELIKHLNVRRIKNKPSDNGIEKISSKNFSKNPVSIVLFLVILGIMLFFIINHGSNSSKNTSLDNTAKLAQKFGGSAVSTDTIQGFGKTIPTPTTSVLDTSITPNYSGADLVKLRQQCSTQAQLGFKKFIQEQTKINNMANIVSGDYSLSSYHFNEKLGDCLIVVDNSFSNQNVGKADTTTLVNIYEDKSIMSCTAYGDPVSSRICYDDTGYPIGEGVSYSDWSNLLNRYMNE